jgi:hypothetical protein
MDAKGCPTCAQNRARAAAAEAPAATGTAAVASPAPVSYTAPDLRALPMKDYHRVVRATYSATERTATGGSRTRAYLPFVLLLILLIVGAAVIFGHMP